MSAGEDDFGSLFEGMVVLGDEDLAVDDPSLLPDDRLSQPLDENLFSDLTITSPDLSLPQPSPSPPPSPSPSASTSSSPAVAVPITRPAGVRRKKRGTVRVGYARGSPAAESENFEGGLEASVWRSPTFEGESAAAGDEEDDDHLDQDLNGVSKEPKNLLQVADFVTTHDGASHSPAILDKNEEKQNHVFESLGKNEFGEARPLSMEERLASIRESIGRRRGEIIETAAALSSARKEAARRRRKAGEDVNSAADKHKELERELEEACETEDFERAERVSEKLLEVELEKLGYVAAHKDAEKEWDAIDLDMHRVLEMQIEAEIEIANLLETFAKDAADAADMISNKATALSLKDSAAWMLSAELLESRKVELDIELCLFKEADIEMKQSIDASVEDDRKMKHSLIERRVMLSEELEELLVLVRKKETEIAENDCMIQEVDDRIAAVVNGCQEAQSVIDKIHVELKSQLSKLELESEALILTKKNCDELYSSEEDKKSKLQELSNTVMAEAKSYFECIELRKNLSASIVRRREDKTQLIESSERMTEEIHGIKQKVSGARATLQDLSLKRASIQQENATAKQRMDFIDKRGPEVENEKRVASAARNFKEAAKLAAEAKALSIEKDSIQNKLDNAVLELKMIEDDIERSVDEIKKGEELILSKEKEAAQTRFKMLHLVAAVARAEESAALELNEAEEAAIFHTEVEAAESEVDKLKEAYGFENFEEKTDKATEHVPMALVVNLAGEKLLEMAGSVIR